MPDLVVSGSTVVTTSAPSFTTTGQDLIEEVKRYIYSGYREEKNKLAAAITTTTSPTTITLTYALNTLQAGSYIAIDQEEMYVWSVDSVAKTAVLERGQNGSTAATHVNASLVYVNPVVSDFRILRALNQEIRALSAEGLFQMKRVDLTYSTATWGYDLTGVNDLIGIYSVFSEAPGGDGYWSPITGWRHLRNQDTADFASSNSLQLLEAPYSGTLRILYRAVFNSLANASDNVQAVTGLHGEAHDIPPLGAAARLVATRETRRGFMEAQGDTRRAEEVPSGHQLRSAQGLLTLRNTRLSEERARLLAKYPIRLR